MAKMKFTSIEEYISAAPKECRPLLKKIRAEIATRVPAAEEAISYNIPAFKTSSRSRDADQADRQHCRCS